MCTVRKLISPHARQLSSNVRHFHHNPRVAPRPLAAPLPLIALFLNIGAFLNISGITKNRTCEPRINTCSKWLTRPSLAVIVTSLTCTLQLSSATQTLAWFLGKKKSKNVLFKRERVAGMADAYLLRAYHGRLDRSLVLQWRYGLELRGGAWLGCLLCSWCKRSWRVGGVYRREI